MKVHKPESFRKNHPEASVILPIFNDRSRHRVRLLRELETQTYRDFEVIVVEGVEPNGRARNEGVKEALGRFLIFMDETSSFAHERVLENLIRPFSERPGLGMTGASVQLHPSASRFQKQYGEIRELESNIVWQLEESDRVQHSCLVIPKAIYQEVGWESDDLITGTDNDLRQRIAHAGYSMVLVPDTLVYHFAPAKLREMMIKGFRKGTGSAYAFLMYPGLFDGPLFLDKPVRSPLGALLYRLASSTAKIFLPRFFLRPVALLYEWSLTLGYISGWFQWVGRKPFKGRPDLHSVREKGTGGVADT